jgi:hypothetical protein
MFRRQFLSQAGLAALAGAVELEVTRTAWKAFWIYPSGAEPNAYGVYHFRHAFQLPSVPATLRVHVSGDSRYQLYVNGQRVCWGPARGDLYHWRYETVDLAPLLKPGRNVLAAVVWNDGAHAAVAQWSNRTAFLVQAADSEQQFVNTGKDWKAARDPGYSAVAVGTYRTTGYHAIGAMENVDAVRCQWGWEKLDYDDSSWAAVELGRTASPRDQRDAPSRWMLVPRPIPLMEEKPQRLAKTRQAEGVTVPAAFPARAAAFEVPAHTKAVLLLDQSHLTCAFPEIDIRGGKGAHIGMRYAEALYAQMKPRQMKGNRNEVEGKQFVGYGDNYMADGARRTYRPLFWRTYRYMRIEIETAAEPLTIEDLRATATGYPFEWKARFDSGVPLHQRILETGWRTARLCAHETYMDCPYYEQLQYAGDTRIQCMVSLYMTGDARLMRNAIEQLDSSRTSEGATYSRAPSVQQQYIPPFSLWWIGMLRDYWWYVPDAPFVRQMLAGVRSVLGFYERFINENGLVGAMPWWNYVDWVDGWTNGHMPVEPHIMPATIHLQLLLAAQWAAEMETALGDKDFAAHDKALADRLKGVIQRSFWASERKMFSEDLGHQKYSQHANALAVLAGLVPQPAAGELMARVSADASISKCSVYFRYYLDRAMVAAGLGDRYLDRLGTWEFMLKEGLSTWAEVDNPYTRSDCHAWGASPNIEFHRTVLGVDSAAPGFAKVRVTPHLGPLQKVSGAVPHPLGLIEVSVERVGNTYKLDVKAPAGVEVLK